MVTGGGDLGELTALVRKGEERVVFQHPSMPSAIQRHIHDENLQFMQHKEVYTPGYFTFIKELVDANLVSLCRREEEGRGEEGRMSEVEERAWSGVFSVVCLPYPLSHCVPSRACWTSSPGP